MWGTVLARLDMFPVRSVLPLNRNRIACFNAKRGQQFIKLKTHSIIIIILKFPYNVMLPSE